MTHTVGFKKQFALEFARLPIKEQDKVLDFASAFQDHGLGDFSKFPGKITYSWRNLPPGSSDYQFAKNNELWHYHIGLPDYTDSVSGKYKTSDWVLHFQWKGQGSHIDLVDLYQHLDASGKFWLPKPGYLVDAPAPDPEA